ncbi:PAS domain-containing protein [Kordiimonas aquimaris]|uniref:PAS domain-containing protein n=1 Tax=Kordiimonas aquimaris TaxID=707591 RepID=UPI0021D1431A|nr:PAS domain-containing protein [Kordiimonas aquimaris]
MTETNFELPQYADHPDICQLLAAWDNWRGDSLLPKRADIKLTDVSNLLKSSLMFDMISDTRIICRYIGSTFLDIYGQDFTGHNYLDLTHPDERAERSRRLMVVAKHPCIAAWAVTIVSSKDESIDIVGVSVPIQPNTDDAPMQLMQVAAILRPIPHSSFTKSDEQNVVNSSDQYSSIDIGAGMPAM